MREVMEKFTRGTLLVNTYTTRNNVPMNYRDEPTHDTTSTRGLWAMPIDDETRRVRGP